MKNVEYKLLAKKTLEGKWGIAIGMGVLFLLITNAASQASFVGLIFVGYPLYFGYAKFNMALKHGYGSIDDLFDGFRIRYMDNAITLFIKGILIILWTFLLIVPGIVKALAYSLVEYILVDEDYPELYNMEALRKSEQMMYGHKMRLFYLYLSFLGWHILGLFTFGILNILYVIPYQYQAVTHFYYDIKSQDMKNEKIEDIAEDILEEISKEEDEWDF